MDSFSPVYMDGLWFFSSCKASPFSHNPECTLDIYSRYNDDSVTNEWALLRWSESFWEIEILEPVLDPESKCAFRCTHTKTRQGWCCWSTDQAWGALLIASFIQLFTNSGTCAVPTSCQLSLPKLLDEKKTPSVTIMLPASEFSYTQSKSHGFQTLKCLAGCQAETRPDDSQASRFEQSSFYFCRCHIPKMLLLLTKHSKNSTPRRKRG